MSNHEQQLPDFGDLNSVVRRVTGSEELKPDDLERLRDAVLGRKRVTRRDIVNVAATPKEDRWTQLGVTEEFSSALSKPYMWELFACVASRAPDVVPTSELIQMVFADQPTITRTSIIAKANMISTVAKAAGLGELKLTKVGEKVGYLWKPSVTPPARAADTESAQ